jgi:ribosomal protein S18 acetylase RimI-like enzyme
MSKLEIKNAGCADIPVIRELTMQVWPQTYTPIIGETQVAYMLGLFYTTGELQKQMEISGHQFIICFDEGVPVAFASWGLVETNIYKLHKLYILPGQQGKGVGRSMVNHIVSEIRENGGSLLRLNVNIHNHAAIRFYEKTGFKRLYDENIDIGNGYFMNDHVLGLSME